MQSGEWRVFVVDSEDIVGKHTSIALDNDNCPHISYYDVTNRDLKYAKWIGSSWHNETVDSEGDVGKWTSIALDSLGYPEISYLDVSNFNLKFAKWTGTNWSVETVDSDGNAGHYTSLALDSNDYPHISYIARGSHLAYAKWNGSAWEIQDLDNDRVGDFTSLALDSRDYPHISYTDWGIVSLRYAEWNGTAWDIQIVEFLGGHHIMSTSIDIDSNDNPHIAYCDWNPVDLKYANRTRGAWSIETVDSVGSVGEYTSMALDSNDRPHFSYYDHTNRELKYAKWNWSGWSIESVDSTDWVGRHTSIALDSSDLPHISYFDLTNSDLKYATKAKLSANQPPVADAGPDQTVYVGDVVQFDGSGGCDPDARWETSTVDSGGRVGYFTSLALDSRDFPHISYQGQETSSLRYAVWIGNNWSIEVVDSSGRVGFYSSIALDGSDNPHISYYESVNYSTDGNVKYAKWTGTSWSIETVDSHGDAGYSGASIAVDSNDNPHIAYYVDDPDHDLRYARWTGTNWSIEVVDSDRNVGFEPSIALDSNDYPHICYYSITNTKLKYAKWTGTNWSIEVVDEPGLVGWGCSIAIDSKDNPHISYQDHTKKNLKYAKWTGTNWSVEAVVPYGHLGGAGTSIVLDSNENPHVSYYSWINWTDGDLGYARWTGTNWTIETADPDGDVGPYSSLALDSKENPHISYYDSANSDLKYSRKGGGIVTYDWDFDDGSPHGSGVRPTHIYNSPGVYNITLTVTDAEGATDTDNCIITVLPGNRPPVADANGPYNADEGSPITLDGSNSYDPDGDALQYRWDLNNDGIWDTGWSSSPYLEYTWGDDHSGQVALQVSDGEFTDTDTANITVRNVAPTVELRMLPIYVNVSLRIAGEKWHDVSIELYEDDVLVAEGNLTRYPGSPNDQMLHLAGFEVNISRNHSAIVRYTPEDDPINGQPNGANPCWIILAFDDGEDIWLHHNFNVQHPDRYVWEADLTAAILSHGLSFEATAYDPGADDLTFHWDFGDGTTQDNFYPNANNTYPVRITDTVTHAFPGSGTYTITLTVEDDDGGIGIATVTIYIP